MKTRYKRSEMERELIESYLTHFIKRDKETGKIKYETYRVMYHNDTLDTNRCFRNLDEAKEYNAKCREYMQKALLNKAKSGKNVVVLDYPENLLFNIDVKIEDYPNLYTEIVPNFNKNFEMIKNKGYLTSKEITVLEKRYRDEKTLEEIGQEFGVTRERIRQIEEKILTKLSCGDLLFILTDGQRKYELMKEKELDSIKEKLTFEAALEVIKNHNNKTNGDLKVSELCLSYRSTRALQVSGYTYLKDLKDVTIHDLFKIRNLGQKSVGEIVSKLKEYGIWIKD